MRKCELFDHISFHTKPNVSLLFVNYITDYSKTKNTVYHCSIKGFLEASITYIIFL
eukprot:GAHX01003023.1.p1 GENE.GAHX01003023.1~~GAHX01003023.1.p1  ORF type:complete len:56 (+),score=1.43 GAHX01003023.1:296-463(+)